MACSRTPASQAGLGIRRAGLLATLLATVWAIPAWGQAPQRVAVLELKAVGLPAEKAQALQTSLGSVLTAETARFGKKVISMADIAAMLAFEKQRELLGCDEASCLAEIGGALGVDLMLSGSIGLVGGTYTVLLTLVDIKKAEVRQRFVGNAGSEAVLTATIQRGVGVLFGEQKDTSGMGAIFVKTAPRGATITLDGKMVGTSPTTIDEVPVGDHLLVATLGDRRTEKAVHVEPESVARVDLTLAESPTVKLMVISDPPEAQVILNGEPKGVTPLMLEAVPSGTASLRVEIEHHEPYETQLSLSYPQFERSGRQAFRHTAKLKPKPGALAITGLPDGAVVTLNEKVIPNETMLTPGRYALKATSSGYETLAQDLVLAPGEDKVLTLQMKPSTAQAAYLEALGSRETAFFATSLTAGGLALFGGAALAVSELSRRSSVRHHERYQDATNQADMDRDYEDSLRTMERARTWRTVGLVGGGAALGAAVLATYWRLTYPEAPKATLSVGFGSDESLSVIVSLP